MSSRRQYPITPEFCYLAMGFIRDHDAAMGLFPSYLIQMGLLSVAAAAGANDMHQKADDVQIGKLQLESVVNARKLLDQLVAMSEAVDNERDMMVLLAAAQNIQGNAEEIVWKMANIEA